MKITRRMLVAGGGVVLVGGAAALLYRPYPSDRTPEGAYMRVARHVSEEHPNLAFPYLETEAQWACYTIRDARKKALARIDKSYPEEEKKRLRAEYAPFADAPDGADVFAMLAARRGWTARLRKDLSGVTTVEVNGERATVVTARGTRYSFRRRENGIWGLTIFTAELVAESERVSRDLALVEHAADDYERGR